MKKKINFNYWVEHLILKQGNLSKVNYILDKVHLSLIKLTGEDSFDVIERAVENVEPLFLLKEKKIGKRVIVVPLFLLSDYTRKFLGLKWIIEEALSKKGPLVFNLTNAFFEAFENKGPVKKKTLDLNTSVLENKSNLKFRW